MSEERRPVVNLVPLLEEAGGPVRERFGAAACPTVRYGPLRELLDDLAAPAQAHELTGEVSVRAAFAASSRNAARTRRRTGRKVAAATVAAGLSFVGLTTGLAAAQVPGAAAKIVGTLLG
ncbi:MAG TPA: hypothetical protein VKW77_06960, partial [Acidimicrobiales bacterium]|nr:hypothetical protein [Acidimicrobiales bacterium]